MRCVNLFRKIKTKRLRTQRAVRWCVLLTAFGFFSLPTASMADNTPEVNATQLIQNYMRTNPVDINTLQQSAMQQLEQLNNLSEADIQAAIQAPNQVNLSIYPIKSTNLTPGVVVSQSIDIMLPQPIFIIGDDAKSRQWLQNYEARLAQIKAQGFVVNVSNAEEMENLRQSVPDLSLYPIPGDAIANWLNLQHYPALISNHLIEQ